MQEAKDTFYITLRDRLAVVNPARTAVVRGVIRPAVIVDENELPSIEDDQGIFHLVWGPLTTISSGDNPLDMLTCEIRYRSTGEDALSAWTRGRELDAMDLELSAMLSPSTEKLRRFTTNGSIAAGTNLFWCENAARSFSHQGRVLERTAKIMIMAYRTGENA